MIWAPFNQNVYVCLADGWSFADTAASADEALAKVQAFLEALPENTRHPGRPDAPPDDDAPASEQKPGQSKAAPGGNSRADAASRTPGSAPAGAATPKPRLPFPWRELTTAAILLAAVAAVVGGGVLDGRVHSPGDAIGYLLAVVAITLTASAFALLPLGIAKRPGRASVTDPMIVALALGSFALAVALYPETRFIDGWLAFQVYVAYVVACYVVRAAIRSGRRTRARSLIRLRVRLETVGGERVL